MGTKVMLGANANSFYDAATGIGVYKGTVVELDARQLNSSRVKRALQGGHLVYAPKEAEKPAEVKKENNADALVKSFYAKANKGLTVEKLAKAFDMNQLTAICEAMSIEVEEGDTKEDLIDALVNVEK